MSYDRYIVKQTNGLLNQFMNWQSITKQKRQVLLLVKEGFSNQKIANELFISVTTVKKHLQNIYRKVGANNKITALIATGMQ